MNKTDRFIPILGMLISLVLVSWGCSTSRPYTLSPVKTFDPDTARIPQPKETEGYQYWDRIDNTIFHQLEKPLDLNRTFRFAGRMLGINGRKQAENVNKLDEVPESSWYNYRHYHEPMTREQLARGPNTVEPDTSGIWTIFSAKLEGANPGFFIEDARGNRFLIKFDGPKYPELTTSAEVIGTKIFYAAGYNVPEATITYFDPDRVTVGEEVMVEEGGDERPMTPGDYREIIENKLRTPNGKIRALASRFVDGTPVGPWTFEGTRSGDPNDRVNHEHRRELRGMRVISSWLNDTDRRDANTMSVFTDRGYIKHFVQDFGNTLGANGAGIHQPIYGQAYLIDPRYMALSTVTLGGYVPVWERVEATVPYPAVGYFRADVFRPGRWVSAHPLPAFENMTLRDAFWGAKIVSSFSDEDIRAIVETGQISNPQAEEYLVKVLASRRDKLARYWFSRINPLDKFRVEKEGTELLLSFDDIGLYNGVYPASETEYEYTISVVGGADLITRPSSDTTRIRVQLDAIPKTRRTPDPVVLKYDIIARRQNAKTPDKSTVVYVALESTGPRVVGIEREE